MTGWFDPFFIWGKLGKLFEEERKKLEKEQKSVIAKKIIGEIYEQSGNLQLIG